MSPTWPCQDEEDEETHECDRGWPVKLNKLTDEADGAAGTRCGVPVEGGLSRSYAHHLARVSKSNEEPPTLCGIDIVTTHRAMEVNPHGEETVQEKGEVQ